MFATNFLILDTNIFSTQKIPYVAILYYLGWLVGWLWFGTTTTFFLTFRDVCQPKKNGTPAHNPGAA